MRECPGIDDDAVDPVPCGLMNAFDEAVLRVALETLEPVSVALGERREVRLDVGECGVTVNIRLARAEKIQVGAVQQEQSSHSVSHPKL